MLRLFGEGARLEHERALKHDIAGVGELTGVEQDGARAQIALMLDFAPGHAGEDVPDPWYGSTQDFIHAFDLIDRGVDGLLARIRTCE